MGGGEQGNGVEKEARTLKTRKRRRGGGFADERGETTLNLCLEIGPKTR